jgi:hypothetical protein
MTANASGESVVRQSPRLIYLLVAAAAASVSGLIVLVSARIYWAAVILVLAWCIVAVGLAVTVMHDRLRRRIAAKILIAWFATAPFAWFFIRFPAQKSIVTYERLVFGLVALLALLGTRRGSIRLLRLKDEVQTGNAAIDRTAVESPLARPLARQGPVHLRPDFRFETAWLLLTLLACFSAVFASGSTGFAFRTAVDAFGLPLVAYYAARTYLGSPEHRRQIAVAAMLLAVFLFGTGAFEFASGINLLPYEGSQIVREGELRVNGPFIADTSFAIVSLLLALFLQSAPRMFSLKFDSTARLFYGVAIVAAIMACLMPLFRAVAIALALCWAAQGILTALPKRRAGPEPLGGQRAGAARSVPSIHWRRLGPAVRPAVTVAIASICLIVAVIVLAPRNVRDRLVSPRNAYSRVLSWRLASNIIYNHPVFGVGLSNYVDYFSKEYSGARTPAELELGTHIVREPHSNIVWIATELGLAGLALYLVANVFLVLPAWRAIRDGRGMPTQAGGACVIVLVAAYWIPGLELTSGMYSELNLYFFFLLGMIFPSLSWATDADRQVNRTQPDLSNSIMERGPATSSSGIVHGVEDTIENHL